jgi:hypothetical protein
VRLGTEEVTVTGLDPSERVSLVDADGRRLVVLGADTLGQARLTVSSPGRDFGAWTFETTGEDGAEREIGRGPGQLSRLVLGELPDIDEVPDLDAMPAVVRQT